MATSPEGKAIQEKTITALTKEALKAYIASFGEKRRERMQKEVDALSIGLQALLCDMNGAIKKKLTPETLQDQKKINKINSSMLDFVNSIATNAGIAEESIRKIAGTAPELDKTEIIAYLRDLGKGYDNVAKIEENTAKIEENIKKNTRRNSHLASNYRKTRKATINATHLLPPS